MNNKTITDIRKQELLRTLQLRFNKNHHRHKGIAWERVETRLLKQPAKLWSLNEMEVTGGEPDVIGYDSKEGVLIFCDCSAESPKGRRSLCYDNDAYLSRKEHRPKDSAINIASEMGIGMLDEKQYHELQLLENFDTKTSSWIKTPDKVRKQGGAIFGDFRFGRVFIYHNGAESYYASRGFRGILKV